MRLYLTMAVVAACLGLFGCGQTVPNQPVVTGQILSKERAAAQTLTQRLNGTRWTAKDNNVFTFHADGTLESSNKDNATWTAIDGHTVIRKTDSNWIDVLLFDDREDKYALVSKDFIKPAEASIKGDKLK